jgi:hypothetical protein
MATHEPRLMPGDPADGPLEQTIAYIADDGKTYYPGDENYVEPEEGVTAFLNDFGAQLADDQHRVATEQTSGMSAEQQERTLSEADRITDPAHPRVGQHQENLPPTPDASPAPQQDPAITNEVTVDTQAGGTVAEPETRRIPRNG